MRASWIGIVHRHYLLSGSVRRRAIKFGKTASILLLLICVSFSAGCRFNDPSVDLLEGELRWMEDQLYEMENQLEQTCVDLSRCQRDDKVAETRREKKSQRQKKSTRELAPVPDPATGIHRIETLGETEQAPNQVIMPDGTVFGDQSELVVDDDASVPDDLIIPPTKNYDLPSDFPVDSNPVNLSIDGDDTVAPTPSDYNENELPAPIESPFVDEPEPTPAEAIPASEVPAQPSFEGPTPGRRPKLEDDFDNSGAIGTPETSTESDQQALLIVPTEEYSIRLQSHVTTAPILAEHDASADGRRPTEKPSIDAHVTHIVTKSQRAQRSSIETGHDLKILVQPRNADGTYVALPASLSIVVLDDERISKGDHNAARIARWDLDATETARRFRTTEFGEGIHLEFDWPHEQPSSEQLHLYVRYTTIDGRKLQAHQILETLDDAKQKGNQGWSVIDRSKPVAQWQVVSESPKIPSASPPTIPPSTMPPSTIPPVTATPSRVTPAIATESPRGKAVVARSSQWELVPADLPAVPGLMPDVPIEPLPKPTPSGVPDTVPKWSPTR